MFGSRLWEKGAAAVFFFTLTCWHTGSHDLTHTPKHFAAAWSACGECCSEQELGSERLETPISILQVGRPPQLDPCEEEDQLFWMGLGSLHCILRKTPILLNKYGATPICDMHQGQ